MFRKMRVTGPNCAEFITQPLQAMRELNPTLNTMIESTEQMNKVLCEAGKQPLKKRRKIASSAVALHDAHLQRLKAFKSDTDYAYNPLFQALAQPPPIPSEAPPTPVDVEDESSLSSRAAMQRVIDAVPKQYRAKAATLGSYLKNYPELIRVTSTGHPIVAGVEIPHSNIMDIMRSLYVWHRGQVHPRGTKEVLEALRSVGVPSFLLSNPTARTMYGTTPETVEPPHVETGEHELAVEEEQQEPQGEEEEEETGTPFETPQHSAMPPVSTYRKVEERVPTKRSPSMIRRFEQKVEEHGPRKPSIPSVPKPEHAGSVAMQTRHASSKASSGIPTMSTKHELSKASSSQAGTGRSSLAEPVHSNVRLPGKPVHVLRLY
jgi:hypothetical protein